MIGLGIRKSQLSLHSFVAKQNFVCLIMEVWLQHSYSSSNNGMRLIKIIFIIFIDIQDIWLLVKFYFMESFPLYLLFHLFSFFWVSSLSDHFFEILHAFAFSISLWKNLRIQLFKCCSTSLRPGSMPVSIFKAIIIFL